MQNFAIFNQWFKTGETKTSVAASILSSLSSVFIAISVQQKSSEYIRVDKFLFGMRLIPFPCYTRYPMKQKCIKHSPCCKDSISLILIGFMLLNTAHPHEMLFQDEYYSKLAFHWCMNIQSCRILVTGIDSSTIFFKAWYSFYWLLLPNH